MARITFQAVRRSRTKRGTCPVCGKPTVRTRVFEHTINPFNLNAEGLPKTPEEVLAAVRAEADAWEPDFTHGKCRG